MVPFCFPINFFFALTKILEQMGVLFSPLALNRYFKWCYAFTMSRHQNLSSLAVCNWPISEIQTSHQFIYFATQVHASLSTWRYLWVLSSIVILLDVLFFMLCFCGFFRIVQCLAICIQVKIQSFSSLSIRSFTALATMFLCYILLQAGKVFYRGASIYLI